MKKNSVLNIWLSVPLYAVAVTLICYILFSLSFLFPVKPILMHMQESADTITEEAMYGSWIEGNPSTKNDGWSECIILSMAVCPTEPGAAFKGPLILRTVSAKGYDNAFEGLNAYVRNPETETEIGSNNRYWNGFVMVLKAALMCFSLSEVRMLFLFVQLSLLCLVVIHMADSHMNRELIPFMLMIYAINPVTLGMSLKLIPEYLVMLGGCLFLLCQKEEFLCDRRKMMAAFTVIGTITSFFNMLSFPLIALGIPLMIWTWKQNRSSECSVRIFLSSIVSWFAGYMISWACKWIACTLFTEDNLIADALLRAGMYHTEGENYTAVVLRNLEVYNNRFTIALFAGALLYFAILAFRNRRSFPSTRQLLNYAVIYGILFLLPFLFFAVMGSAYAYNHHYMAYRNLVFAITAPVCFVMHLSDPPETDAN